MPAVTTANQVVREDLSDAMLLSDIRNTPFSSRIKKGEKVKNMLFSWTAEILGNRNVTPPPENADVTTFENDQQTRIYNRAQRFWRTPRVSVIAEKVNDAAANFGKYNKQVAKKIKDQKRDVETVLMSIQDSSDDTGTVGAKMMGIGRAIDDGTLGWTDTQTVIPATYRTPTAQLYTGVLTNLTDEATLIAILKARWDALGMSRELICYSGSAVKQQISTYFGKYTPNKTNFTTVVRTQQEALDSRKFAGYGIDVFEGDFGTFELVLCPFIGWDGATQPAVTNTKYAYGIDMDTVTMRPLMYCDHTELPYLGGGLSGLVDSILGYEFGDPRAHFKIAAT